MKLEFTLTEQTIFSQLFGSKNVRCGGIGRVDKSVVDRASNPARLAEYAKYNGYRVIRIGTDYIVFNPECEFERIH